MLLIRKLSQPLEQRLLSMLRFSKMPLQLKKHLLLCKRRRRQNKRLARLKISKKPQLLLKRKKLKRRLMPTLTILSQLKMDQKEVNLGLQCKRQLQHSQLNFNLKLTPQNQRKRSKGKITKEKALRSTSQKTTSGTLGFETSP